MPFPSRAQGFRTGLLEADCEAISEFNSVVGAAQLYGRATWSTGIKRQFFVNSTIAAGGHLGKTAASSVRIFRRDVQTAIAVRPGSITFEV